MPWGPGQSSPEPQGQPLEVAPDQGRCRAPERLRRPRWVREEVAFMTVRSEHSALTRADRAARGKDARGPAPLEAHADFAPGSRDPIGLLLEQEKTRVAELVPVRHGRMLASPFAFYRGAAL